MAVQFFSPFTKRVFNHAPRGVHFATHPVHVELKVERFALRRRCDVFRVFMDVGKFMQTRRKATFQKEARGSRAIASPTAFNSFFFFPSSSFFPSRFTSLFRCQLPGFNVKDHRGINIVNIVQTFEDEISLKLAET